MEERGGPAGLLGELEVSSDGQNARFVPRRNNGCMQHVGSVFAYHVSLILIQYDPTGMHVKPYSSSTTNAKIKI